MKLEKKEEDKDEAEKLKGSLEEKRNSFGADDHNSIPSKGENLIEIEPEILDSKDEKPQKSKEDLSDIPLQNNNDMNPETQDQPIHSKNSSHNSSKKSIPELNPEPLEQTPQFSDINKKEESSFLADPASRDPKEGDENEKPSQHSLGVPSQDRSKDNSNNSQKDEFLSKSKEKMLEF